LKWYFKDIKGGELPTTGQLLFKQGTWDQIRQDAGLFRNSDGKSLWPYDASRNSFTSYANHYVEWKEKSARDYWMDRCGHDYATFKKYLQGASCLGGLPRLLNNSSTKENSPTS